MLKILLPQTTDSRLIIQTRVLPVFVHSPQSGWNTLWCSHLPPLEGWSGPYEVGSPGGESFYCPGKSPCSYQTGLGILTSKFRSTAELLQELKNDMTWSKIETDQLATTLLCTDLGDFKKLKNLPFAIHTYDAGFADCIDRKRPLFWSSTQSPVEPPVMLLSTGRAVPSVHIQVLPSSERVSPIHTGRTLL